MPDLLIRRIDSQTLAKLKARATRNRRSLQSEIKLILEQAAGITLIEAMVAAGRWRKKLAPRGKQLGDSVTLLRKDRER